MVVAEGTAGDLAREPADGHSFFELVAESDRLQAALDESSSLAADDVGLVGANGWRVSIPSGETQRLLPALVEAGVDVSELRDLGSDLDEIHHRYFTRSEEVTQ